MDHGQTRQDYVGKCHCIAYLGRYSRSFSETFRQSTYVAHPTPRGHCPSYTTERAHRCICCLIRPTFEYKRWHPSWPRLSRVGGGWGHRVGSARGISVPCLLCDPDYGFDGEGVTDSWRDDISPPPRTRPECGSDPTRVQSSLSWRIYNIRLDSCY